MALWLTVRPLHRGAGVALLVCVATFGLATVVFGVSTSFPLSLAMLAVLGAADMVSVVVRSALLQYRRVTKARVGYYIEAGAGIVSFTERLRLRSSAGELLNIAGYSASPRTRSAVDLRSPCPATSISSSALTTTAHTPAMAPCGPSRTIPDS